MSIPLNLDQIMRLAQYQAGAVKQSGTAGSVVSTHELQTWANQGNVLVENMLRRFSDDYFVKTLNSATDTTALKLDGINYTPSTSLALAADTREYSLPPDFLSLKSIRAVTSGYESVTFTQRDIASAEFQQLLKLDSSVSPGSSMAYDITGTRTLVIAPLLNAALDIEIRYVAQTKMLVRYSTGTIAVTNATAAVAGTLTYWASRFDQDYLDIMYGTSTVATVPTPDPSLSYDDVFRSRVLTVTDNTNIVTATNKNGTLAAGTGYLLSSLPVVPSEYHQTIADYVTYKILLKSGSKLAMNYRDEFAKSIERINSTATRRNQADIETVESMEWD